MAWMGNVHSSASKLCSAPSSQTLAGARMPGMPTRLGSLFFYDAYR